jgi:hypothetical protein
MRKTNVHEIDSDLVVSKEERYEIIAQVARAMEARKEDRRAEYSGIWDSSDTGVDFSTVEQLL